MKRVGTFLDPPKLSFDIHHDIDISSHSQKKREREMEEAEGRKITGPLVENYIIIQRSDVASKPGLIFIEARIKDEPPYEVDVSKVFIPLPTN